MTLAIAGGAELEVESLSGHIAGDGGRLQRTGRADDERKGYVLGEGGARIKMESVSGTINVGPGERVLERE